MTPTRKKAEEIVVELRDHFKYLDVYSDIGADIIEKALLQAREEGFAEGRSSGFELCKKMAINRLIGHTWDDNIEAIEALKLPSENKAREEK